MLCGLRARPDLCAAPGNGPESCNSLLLCHMMSQGTTWQPVQVQALLTQRPRPIPATGSLSK